MQNRGQNLRIPELLIKLSKSSVNSEAAISVLNSRQNERNLVTKFEPKSSEYAFAAHSLLFPSHYLIGSADILGME